MFLYMKNALFLLLLVLISIKSQAQFIKEKSFTAKIGYGLSAPDKSDAVIINTGVFAQGELVLGVLSWVEMRPYVGVIITNSNGKDVDNNPTDEKAETKAALLGGKLKVRAPIPWVAPYIEVGLGASIGTFETFTADHDIDKSGIIYHTPFSLGLELGKKRNVDLGFTYYFQPSVEQFVGAVAVGLTFPLDM